MIDVALGPPRFEPGTPPLEEVQEAEYPVIAELLLAGTPKFTVIEPLPPTAFTFVGALGGVLPPPPVHDGNLKLPIRVRQPEMLVVA